MLLQQIKTEHPMLVLAAVLALMLAVVAAFSYCASEAEIDGDRELSDSAELDVRA